MSTRIHWIDGLRGVSSVFIFIHHFILAFYPAMYYGKEIPSHLFGLDYMLADSPLMFFVGGHFLVCVFLLLSGIVLTFQYREIKYFKDLLSSAFKRYLKLSIPLFLVSMIVFIFQQLNLFHNSQITEISYSPWLFQLYSSVPTLEKVFTTSFLTVWIFGDDTFSTAFWMLNLLFFGSLMTLIVRFIINRRYIHKYLVYSVLIILFVMLKSLLLNFVFGMIIADIIVDRNLKNKPLISVFFLVGSVIFGGYPFGIEPTNFYKYFSLLPDYFSNANFIHTIGSLMLFSGIVFNKKLKNMLSTKSMSNLGTLSYAIYLIHIPLLFAFSTFLMSVLYPLLANYNLSVLIVLLMTLPVLILLSIFAQKVFSHIDEIIKKITI